MDTQTLAARLGLRPQSIRAQVCRTGDYFGLRPGRLPNNRLLWPADSVERLLATGEKTTFRVPGKRA